MDDDAMNGSACPCGCGIAFTELDAAIGEVIFHEKDHHGATDQDIRMALANVLWGFLGGYDSDRLVQARLYREGDELMLEVTEGIPDDEVS